MSIKINVKGINDFKNVEYTIKFGDNEKTEAPFSVVLKKPNDRDMGIVTSENNDYDKMIRMLQQSIILLKNPPSLEFPNGKVKILDKETLLSGEITGIAEIVNEIGLKVLELLKNEWEIFKDIKKS